MLRYFHSYRHIDTIVFTNTTETIELCNTMNISTLRITGYNKFGIPILSSMLESVRRLYQSDYFIYINSDILLNPKLFTVLNTVKGYFTSPV